MDTQHELDRWLDKPTRLKHGIDGFRVVFPVVLSEKCQLQQLLLREYTNLCPRGDLARKFQYRPWNPGVHDQLAREIVQPEVAQHGELMIIACPSLVHAVCTCALY
jgi:hypothetical protein